MPCEDCKDEFEELMVEASDLEKQIEVLEKRIEVLEACLDEVLGMVRGTKDDVDNVIGKVL